MSSALARRGTAPQRHVYDLIIVGGQLSGAMCAAVCARRGLHVLHVAHDGLAAQYSHKNCNFPHTAFVMPAAKAVPSFDELVAEVGLARTIRQPSLQLLRPANWFELKRDEKERAAELKRALRTTADAFEQELARAVSAAAPSEPYLSTKPDLLPEGLFARWRFKRQLPKLEGLEGGCPLPKDSVFRAFLPWAAGVDDPAPLTEARPFGRLLASVCTVPGGREGLVTLFTDRARELGADVLGPDIAVEQIIFDGSHAAGVRLSRVDTVYRAPFIVGATDLDVLQRLVPEQKSSAPKYVPRATRAVFTLNFVVPEAALPRGLGELALVDFGGGPLLLQVDRSSGLGINPETTDLRTVTVSCVAPLAVKAGSQAAIKALIDDVWGRLAHVMPFTRAHVKLESTPWLDSAAVVDRGAEPLPLFERSPESWLGVTGLPTSSCWKRLLLATRQVLPGLGLEGEVLAALRVADRVVRVVKKNDPLRKRGA